MIWYYTLTNGRYFISCYIGTTFIGQLIMSPNDFIRIQSAQNRNSLVIDLIAAQEVA